MKYIFDKSTKKNSRFVAEDYFPAIIQFSSEELNNRFIEFSYQDTDMFELVGNSNTGELKQFTFTLCNHFNESDKSLSVPLADEGNIILGENDTILCEKFIANIYKDGIRIDISDNEVCITIDVGSWYLHLTSQIPSFHYMLQIYHQKTFPMYYKNFTIIKASVRLLSR